jgi:hypothetical protein
MPALFSARCVDCMSIAYEVAAVALWTTLYSTSPQVAWHERQGGAECGALGHQVQACSVLLLHCCFLADEWAWERLHRVRYKHCSCKQPNIALCCCDAHGPGYQHSIVSIQVSCPLSSPSALLDHKYSLSDTRLILTASWERRAPRGSIHSSRQNADHS